MNTNAGERENESERDKRKGETNGKQLQVMQGLNKSDCSDKNVLIFTLFQASMTLFL